jgi:MFS family permease
VSSAGQILGNGSCGFVLALGGFHLAFGVLAGLAVGALLLALGTSQTHRRKATGGGLFDNYRVLVRMPVLLYGALCAYLSALPFSLAMSFYPLLLQFLGFGEEASGVLLALRAVGGIASGLITVFFQVTMAELVEPRMLGSAMALGGVGWGVSHLTTPLIMGFLSDRYGIVAGFYVLGGISLAVIGGVALLRNWAFAQTKLAAQ